MKENVFPKWGIALFFCLLIFLFFLSPFIAAESHAQTDQMNNAIITLVTPEEGAEVTSKKPFIKCAITEPFSPENLLVLLDETDVTGILDITPEGFEFSPLQVLPSGTHYLSVTAYTEDGQEIQKDFTFTTRYSKTFEEVYSTNEVTAQYEAVLKKPKDVDMPYSRIEANLGSETGLREKDLEITFNTNLRYFDQNRPVYSPEEKGISLINFLLQSRYSINELQLLAEVGDVNVNETQYTVQGLSRRGGKVSLNYRSLDLNAFVVKSEQVFGFEGGFGIEGSTDDHIMGISGGIGLLSDRVKFRTIYVKGGEEGSSFGYYSAGGNRKGEVLGFALSTDIIEDKLKADAEIGFSEYDADTSDEFSSENDTAYKFTLSGYSGKYSYEALYEYIGPDYEVIGNQGLQRNQEGFSIRGSANFEKHSINLSFSSYNDNVKKDDLYPRIYTYQATADYTFNGIQSLPIGISYQKSILDSAMEPEFTLPMRTDSDMISGRISYMKGNWNLGLQASHSIQDDREELGNDTNTTTYTFTPSYYTEHFSVSPNFSFNRSKYKSTDVRNDTYTANLDVRGEVFHNKVKYEIAGTFNRTKSSDGFTELNSFNSNCRVSYLLGEKLWGFLSPTASLRGQYNKTNDRVFKQESEELVILFVFSTSIPFSI